MTVSGGAAPAAEKSKGQPFFAIDFRLAEIACEMGLDVGVAYFTMAAGTGGDHVTTSWSASAIKKHTGMDFARAQACIDHMIEHGLVVRAKVEPKRGSAIKPLPRYKLVTFAELLERELDELPPAGRAFMRAVIDKQDVELSDEARRDVVAAGWFDDEREVLHFDYSPSPSWAWFGRSFVVVTGNEASPLSRLRRSRQQKALLLALNLCYVQMLAEDFGIPRDVIGREHDREKLGRFGSNVIWGFKRLGKLRYSMASRAIINQVGQAADGETEAERLERVQPFLDMLDLLERCGVLEFHHHLVEGADEGSQVLHAIGWGKADSLTNQVGYAAHKAAVLLARAHGQAWASNIDEHDPESVELRLVPAPITIPEVQLVEIARMRNKANTRLTGAWHAKTQDGCEQAAGGYEAILRLLMAMSMKDIAVA